MSHSRTLVLAFDGDAVVCRSRSAASRIACRRTSSTVTLDLGQGGDLEQVREQALAAGAARAHVVDARERFAGEVLLPALRAGAAHPAATTPASLARPIVAARVGRDRTDGTAPSRSRMARAGTRARRSSG